jgi:hypothetical protein
MRVVHLGTGGGGVFLKVDKTVCAVLINRCEKRGIH